MNKYRILPVLGLIILLGDPGNARAKTLYVSPAGDDAREGTLAAPVATVPQAISLADSGDTIYLRGGKYAITRFIWIDKPNITISSFPGETAALIGSSTDQGKPDSIFIVVADHVSLINLEIQGGWFYGIKVDVDQNKSTTGVIIRGCRIRDTGADCIKTFNADALLIEDCEIGPSGVRDSSNAEGIDSIGSKGVIIRRSYIHDTATNGVYLKGGAKNGLIENCRVENTGKHAGILLGQDTDAEFMRDETQYEAINCTARNNIIVNTGGAGMGTYSGSNIRFENNTLVDVAKLSQAGLWVVTNNREVPSEKISFKNNIIVMNSERPLIFVLNLADALISDANLYHNTQNAPKFRRETTRPEQSNDWDFEQWKQQMNADAASITADPMLRADDLYRLNPTSPAIDRGEKLAEVTKDYSGTARPQGAGYDIGAHERPAGNKGSK